MNLNILFYDSNYQKWYGGNKLYKKVLNGLTVGIVGVILVLSFKFNSDYIGFEKYFDNILILYIYIIYSNVEDFVKEGRIMKIDPRIISKIYLNDLTRLAAKRICKRYYTTTIDQINSLCKKHKDFKFWTWTSSNKYRTSYIKRKTRIIMKRYNNGDFY